MPSRLNHLRFASCSLDYVISLLYKRSNQAESFNAAKINYNNLEK